MRRSAPPARVVNTDSVGEIAWKDLRAAHTPSNGNFGAIKAVFPSPRAAQSGQTWHRSSKTHGRRLVTGPARVTTTRPSGRRVHDRRITVRSVDTDGVRKLL